MTAPEILVYGKPGCHQCVMTTKWLTIRGLPHTYVDITTDPQHREVVETLGYRGLPVVVAGDIHFGGGFRNDQLKALAKAWPGPDLTECEAAAVASLGEEL